MSIICIQSINEKKNHIRYEVDTDSQPLGVVSGFKKRPVYVWM